MTKRGALGYNQKLLVVIGVVIMVGFMGTYPDIFIFGGPIVGFPEEPDPSFVDMQSGDRYCVTPHLEYIGNVSDSEWRLNGDWLVRAEILVRDDVSSGGYGFREGMALTVTNMSTNMIETIGTYSPTAVENMMVLFNINITDGDHTYYYQAILTIADASIEWHDSGYYVKSYNTIDNGFSISLFLSQPPANGGVVYNPDPIVDADIKNQQYGVLAFIMALAGFGGIMYVYYGARKRARAVLMVGNTLQYRNITDVTIPSEPEPEYTEEELEEMRLDRIHKDSRLKVIEEIIQSLTAINDPNYVLEYIEQTIEGFEPENEREARAFSILLNLFEEVQEKLKDE